MEVTRAHLQKELRARDMECERLKVHIKVLHVINWNFGQGQILDH